jgi:hypothetical protein
MLTRRRLLAGAGTSALAFIGLGHVLAAEPPAEITVYKSPT